MQIFLRNLFYLFSVIYLLNACQQRVENESPPTKTIKSTDPNIMADFEIPYKLNKPNEKFKLPNKLTEISGIQYIEENVFACIQDEAGKIYIFNTKKDEIVEDYHFAKDGDYEDLEIIGNTVYVIRSDGRLYKIDDFPAEKMEVRHRDLPLSIKNDVEGLCYDPQRDQLLIACKAQAGIKEKVKKKKAVYSFSLQNKEFDLTPRFLIDIDELKEFADEKKLDFQPSGIAVHPLSGNIYIIASAGKLLVILNSSGKLLAVKELDEDELKQPEGITFDPDGNLYISNEGRGGKGNILYFKYKKLNE